MLHPGDCRRLVWVEPEGTPPRSLPVLPRLRPNPLTYRALTGRSLCGLCCPAWPRSFRAIVQLLGQHHVGHDQKLAVRERGDVALAGSEHRGQGRPAELHRTGGLRSRPHPGPGWRGCCETVGGTVTSCGPAAAALHGQALALGRRGICCRA